MSLSAPVGAEEAPRPVVVLLSTAVGAAATDDVLEPVRAELADLPIELVIEPAVDFPPTLPAQVTLAAERAARLEAGMVFWFDVSLPDRVFVYLSEPGGSRVLVRTVEAASTAERLGSAAVIVRGLVKALVGGGTIGVEMPDRPPATGAGDPEPSRVAEAAGPGPEDAAAAMQAGQAPTTPGGAVEPAATASAVPALGLRLSYGLDFFADEALPMHGLEPGLAFRVQEHWSLFATYRILFDAELSGAGLDLDVARHPVQLGVQLHWTLGDWDVGGSVATVIDYVTAEASARTAEVTAVTPGGTWLGGFDLLAHVSYRIAGSFRVFLDEGVELLVNRVEYVVDRPDGRALLLESWYVCPRLQLGIQVDLL